MTERILSHVDGEPQWAIDLYRTLFDEIFKSRITSHARSGCQFNLMAVKSTRVKGHTKTSQAEVVISLLVDDEHNVTLRVEVDGKSVEEPVPEERNAFECQFSIEMAIAELT